MPACPAAPLGCWGFLTAPEHREQGFAAHTQHESALAARCCIRHPFDWEQTVCVLVGKVAIEIVPWEHLDTWSHSHVPTSEVSRCSSWWLFRGQSKIGEYAYISLGSVYFMPFLSGWFKGREHLWARIIHLLPDWQHLPQQSHTPDLGSPPVAGLPVHPIYLELQREARRKQLGQSDWKRMRN